MGIATDDGVPQVPIDQSEIKEGITRVSQMEYHDGVIYSIRILIHHSPIDLCTENTPILNVYRPQKKMKKAQMRSFSSRFVIAPPPT